MARRHSFWCCGRREIGKGSEEEEEGLFMSLKSLEAATDGFSDSNRLGQGGFGPVFKGVLGDGREIAVKKLSMNSRQGIKEFTNEVRLLLRVQHKNLVTLFGCCIDGREKMLVYQYLPNKSLDYFLFDQDKRSSLDWITRFEIIKGVAKGLAYLHEESPVRIIHRDIKASNILLDDQMVPKISDFGLARLFAGDDTHVNTFKISGTHGYMAPEYVMNGYLSVKTDVFSYGVLVLEIVSGRKNHDPKLGEENMDLLRYAWKQFKAGNALQIVDPSLKTWDGDEAAMCVQLGLLCCQASIADRPDMNTINLTLSSDSFQLPRPGKPGLHGRGGRSNTNSSSTAPSTNASSSRNTGTTNLSSSVEDYSRNSISVSFTTEGR